MSAATTSLTRRVSLWAPVVTYMALIFFVSSQPSAPLPESVSDKGAHLLAYSVLGVLSVRAAGGGLPCRVTVPIALTALALTSGYGALDEWRQGFVPGRSQEIADWYADTAGAVVSIGVCWAWGMMRALGRRSP